MEQPSFDLSGRVALVTGASRGIGHDLALALEGAGATVVSGVRGDEAPTESVQMDLRDVSSIRSAVAEVVARHGKLDVLVNNAGLGTNHDALDATEEEWDELMAVNLRGLFFASQAAGRHMVRAGYGRIVNMSSQAAHVGIRRHAAYSASKGGVELLTKVLALEWGPHGVTVNAVAPTFIRTPGTAERLDRPEFLEDVLSRIPIGRVGTTSEVAAAVIFLASPSAGLVNGTSILVDGGWTAQ
ncbi:MAG TPA: SDR family oxidoreductase [Gaiellaceae bacterium]|jgi:NAD(P)-dependent dehydrogenase (short-subunit alcohol dehydrogenase family)|nr:SDR family oxidoreductase [Gaiellaceae bacterium]